MKITVLPVALLLVVSICSCAKTWMEDKTADTSAVDNSDAVTSISVTPQSAEPGVYTELADFLTDEQIQLYNKALEIYPLFNGMPDTIDYLYLSLQGKPWDKKIIMW